MAMVDRYLIRQAARPPGTPTARLETHLHHRLADRRLNLVNTRREFFRAKPAEVRDILIRLDASIVEWIDEPQALEWRQSPASPARARHPRRGQRPHNLNAHIGVRAVRGGPAATPEPVLRSGR